MCGVVGQRRRSRINEKMKALQNLIPNSNKVHKYIRYQLWSLQSLIGSNLLGLIFFFFKCRQTDKASMLDEAIEYLKQLQLQVQVCGAFSKTCILSQQKDSYCLSSLLIVSWISYNLMSSTYVNWCIPVCTHFI